MFYNFAGIPKTNKNKIRLVTHWSRLSPNMPLNECAPSIINDNLADHFQISADNPRIKDNFMRSAIASDFWWGGQECDGRWKLPEASIP